jgi:hypothetical protein
MENGYTSNNINNSTSSAITASSSYQIPKQFMLTRGFSKVQANEEILNETRSKIKNKLCKSTDDEDCSFHLLSELPDYSFMLPDLNRFDDYKFKEYLTNDLIELPTQYALTESGHLNWWSQGNWENVCRPLYPMVTSGDGNCLLHAASLAMWGLHDRYLVLRKALHSTLENIKENSSPLWRRWKWEQMCQNRKYGLIYNDDEWSKEWKSLLKLSSYQPRISNVASTSSSTSSNNINGITNGYQSTSDNNNDTLSSNLNIVNQDGQVYFESLEEFHVFLLAHILQRPIIIVADTMLHDSDGEPLSPIPFGGIYLPMECDLQKCHRYPLVLAYDSAHFSALVLMDDVDFEANNNELNNPTNGPSSTTSNSSSDSNNQNKNCYVDIEKINKKLQTNHPFSIIPITYSNRDLLPIHFAYDPGSDYDWSNFPGINNENCSNSTNDNEQSNGNSNNNNNHVKKNNSIQNNSELELTKDQKLFLLQKYLDIVKLQLYEPGPTVKRNQNIPTNSSGLRVNVTNVRVNELATDSSLSDISSLNSNEKIKTLKQTANNKLQKFLNIFKKSASNNTPILINTKPLSIDSKSFDDINKTSNLSSLNNQNTIFHKLVHYKNWNALFDSMNHYICLLGVKLNLAKPPKFNRIIKNYLELAQHKFEIIKQQHQLQHQQKINNNVINRNNNIVSVKSISNSNSINDNLEPNINGYDIRVEDVENEDEVYETNINNHNHVIKCSYK